MTNYEKFVLISVCILLSLLGIFVSCMSSRLNDVEVKVGETFDYINGKVEAIKKVNNDRYVYVKDDPLFVRYKILDETPCAYKLEENIDYYPVPIYALASRIALPKHIRILPDPYTGMHSR